MDEIRKSKDELPNIKIKTKSPRNNIDRIYIADKLSARNVTNSEITR